MTQQAPTQRFKPAVGYVRCSTDMQEESPEQQKKEILAFAARSEYEVVEWFEDFGKSGTTFEERPAFRRLRERVENKPNFEAVICYDESRWGRAIDAEENTFWRVYFRKRGVDVVLVKTSVDPKNDFAPMLKAFEGVQASQYSKKLSELTMRGSMNNGVYSSGGTAPYGYERIAVNLRTGSERKLQQGEWCVRRQEKVKWVLGHKKEIETVRYIFEQRAKGLAYIQIVKKLNESGVPCPRRGRWRNLDRKWSTVTIKTILENPAYYGARVYNKMSSSRIVAQLKGRNTKPYSSYPSWKNDRGEWIIVEKAHAPVVTKELWEKANVPLRCISGRRERGYKFTTPYLLTGLVYCSSCGFAFQGSSTKARGKKYYRYIDGGWHNKRVCSHLGIPREQLEDFAVKAVKETIADPTLVNKIEENLVNLMKNEPNQRKEDVKRIESELAEIALKKHNLIQAIELGKNGVALEILINRLGELQQSELLLQKKVIEIQSKLDNAQIHLGDWSDAVARFVLDFEKEFQKAPIEDRKSLIKKCISRIIVEREEGLARFYVRRIPAVTPELQRLFQPAENPRDVVSSVSARNRT